MAKNKKFDTSLKIRKKYSKMAFVGKFGEFDYSEPRVLGEMTKEELEAFYYAHGPKARQRYLVGKPAVKATNIEELPIKPEE